MLPNGEPGYRHDDQYVNTVEADSLLKIISVPEGLILEECYNEDGHHNEEHMLSGNFYDFSSLILYCGIILDEKLKHELLLGERYNSVN
jgi:hypothetical protein